MLINSDYVMQAEHRVSEIYERVKRVRGCIARKELETACEIANQLRREVSFLHYFLDVACLIEEHNQALAIAEKVRAEA